MKIKFPFKILDDPPIKFPPPPLMEQITDALRRCTFEVSQLTPNEVVLGSVRNLSQMTIADPKILVPLTGGLIVREGHGPECPSYLQMAQRESLRSGVAAVAYVRSGGTCACRA